MEAFAGKWKTGALPENIDEYAKATGTGDMVEIFKKPQTYEISVSGDTMTTVTSIEGFGTHTTTAKLGEKKKINAPPFGECEVLATLKGNELVTEQDFGTFQQVLRSYVKDGVLFVITEAKGVKMTGRLTKA